MHGINWEELKELKLILTPFNEATEIICGSLYPTLGLTFSTIVNLEIMLESIIITNNKISKIRSQMMVEISERFEAFSDVQLTGSFLDPRIKRNTLPQYISIDDCMIRIKDFLKIFEKKEEIYPENYQAKKAKLGLKDMIFRNNVCENNISNEISKYLSFPPCSDMNLNPYSWWQLNRGQFPVLSEIAMVIKIFIYDLCLNFKDFLLCQASSAASERGFSKSSDIIVKKRNSLNDSSIEALVCLKSWM